MCTFQVLLSQKKMINILILKNKQNETTLLFYLIRTKRTNVKTFKFSQLLKCFWQLCRSNFLKTILLENKFLIYIFHISKHTFIRFFSRKKQWIKLYLERFNIEIVHETLNRFLEFVTNASSLFLFMKRKYCIEWSSNNVVYSRNMAFKKPSSI